MPFTWKVLNKCPLGADGLCPSLTTPLGSEGLWLPVLTFHLISKTPLLLHSWLVCLFSCSGGTLSCPLCSVLGGGTCRYPALSMPQRCCWVRQCGITGPANTGAPARLAGFWVRGSSRQTCALASSSLSKARGKWRGSSLLSGDLGKSPLCVFVSSSVKWINNRTYGRIQGLWGLKL